MSCPSTYCISNTSFSTYNDIYESAGTHNGYDAWSGQSNGYHIYFNTGTTQWCLSNVLDGTCLLSGKSPCTSTCPDLFSGYLSSGTCPTPTPTPTVNCSVLDFNSYFDCVPVNFITSTPTASPTPTLTQTPTPTDFCGLLNVDVTVSNVTPTPTKTPTQTPTSSKPVIRDISFLGDVTFNTVNTSFNCPTSKQFSDCYDPNTIYSTTDVLIVPDGTPITQYMVFNALVDGSTKCISYIGETTDIIGGNTIQLNSNPLGYSNLGGCGYCQPTPTPTKTPTRTPFPTPTPTQTQTQTPSQTPTQTQTPSQTQTQTPTQTQTQTPTQTVTPSQPAIALCLTEFKIVATYYNESAYVSVSGGGTCVGPDCAPCGMGHNCCRARFYVKANDITVIDSNNPSKNTISLNNSGCPSYNQAYNTTVYIDDLNYPTGGFFPPGYTGISRYDEITIGSSQAQTIATSSQDGNIRFGLTYATPISTTEHDGVTWIRLYRNNVLIYNGCPTGNFVTINPCTGQVVTNNQN
jgi:hypothetical protein